MVVCPDFVACVEEFVGEQLGVGAVEFDRLHSDVVEADVDGRASEPFVFLFVVGVAVEVVVEGVVVHHLCNGQVVEEARVFGDA